MYEQFRFTHKSAECLYPGERHQAKATTKNKMGGGKKEWKYRPKIYGAGMVGVRMIVFIVMKKLIINIIDINKCNNKNKLILKHLFFIIYKIK